MATMGVGAVDDMYDFTAECSWYPAIEVPLEELGVKMGTIEEFARSVIKLRMEG